MAKRPTPTVTVTARKASAKTAPVKTRPVQDAPPDVVTRPGPLKPFADRARQAFGNFAPSKLPGWKKVPSGYVDHKANPAPKQREVIQKGLTKLSDSATKRVLRLKKNATVEKLMQPSRAGETSRAIDLAQLHDYVSARVPVGTITARAGVLTACKARLQAEKIASQVKNLGAPAPPAAAPGAAPDTATTPAGGDIFADPLHLTAGHLVKEAVSVQMAKANSPEGVVNFAIPDRTSQVGDVGATVQTFELRSGAADVTAYHDFNSLQIAFEHIWTELFDNRVQGLGQQLYEQYIKLKAYAADTPDKTINTLVQRD